MEGKHQRFGVGGNEFSFLDIQVFIRHSTLNSYLIQQGRGYRVFLLQMWFEKMTGALSQSLSTKVRLPSCWVFIISSLQRHHRDLCHAFGTGIRAGPTSFSTLCEKMKNISEEFLGMCPFWKTTSFPWSKLTGARFFSPKAHCCQVKVCHPPAKRLVPLQQHPWLLQSGLEACSGTLPSAALCLGTEGYTLTLLMSAMSSLSVRSCSFMSPVKFFSFFIDAFQVAY